MGALLTEYFIELSVERSELVEKSLVGDENRRQKFKIRPRFGHDGIKYTIDPHLSHISSSAGRGNYSTKDPTGCFQRSCANNLSSRYYEDQLENRGIQRKVPLLHEILSTQRKYSFDISYLAIACSKFRPKREFSDQYRRSSHHAMGFFAGSIGVRT